MTDRLYYEDSYLKTFEAQVLECRETLGAWLIRLDRSAFYPTSGGQPYDEGTLGGARILDVFVDEEGEVWHKTDARLSVGETVRGEIDWQRRFDHMQQHAGEHMLAGAVHRLFSGYTVGLHLGKEDSSIDVSLPDGRTRLTDSELEMLEDDVNRHIQADVPIRCYFPDEETLRSLPLRKAPAVSEHIRIVQIGDDEYCACGGTHPSSAGQVGLVKIIDARPSKGKMRLTFLCGMRAFLNYRAYAKAAEGAANALSSSYQLLPGAVETLIARAKEAEYKLSQYKKESAIRSLPMIMENAVPVGNVKCVSHVFSSLGMEGLREAASECVKNPGCIALFADESESGVLLVFGRSADVNLHIGKILSSAAKQFGGKGGGKPEFAQGAAASKEVLSYALTQIQTEINAESANTP